MAQQIAVDPSAVMHAAQASADKTGLHALLPDLLYQRVGIVNVMFIRGHDNDWVLVDAGLPGTAELISKSVEAVFGKESRPRAILLTHGHFDHVGALEALAGQWKVPIFAHELELPYLNGTASYPPPDPTVGGGLMASASKLYPRGPVDVSRHLETYAADGTVPFLPGWRWVHVPGHTPGQVAFWRESDRTLIAADAFVTTAQESVYSVALQKPELHGPPMYYTQDWQASRDSVRKLARLEPQIVVTGHGRALFGPEMRRALDELAARFDEVAVPAEGRYVRSPAVPEDGSAYPAPPEKGSS